MLERDAEKIALFAKFPVHQVSKPYDQISFSHKKEKCPNINLINKKFQQTDLFDQYVKKAKKLMTPAMIKEYGNDYIDDIWGKFETLRYSYFYGFETKVKINEDDIENLKEARRLLQLRKGYFIPTINKLGCHSIFHQFFNFFDFAIAVDTIGEEKFQKIALFYHKVLASRDEAYIPRYKWLLSNPGVLSKLRGVIFENHDDLVFMIMRAISENTNKELATPFASNVVIELHKDSSDNSYHIKVLYNMIHVKLHYTLNEKSLLKLFAKSLRKGTFFSDQEFFSVCYGKYDHSKPLKIH